jgi:hypothetical protein
LTGLATSVVAERRSRRPHFFGSLSGPANALSQNSTDHSAWFAPLWHRFDEISRLSIFLAMFLPIGSKRMAEAALAVSSAGGGAVLKSYQSLPFVVAERLRAKRSNGGIVVNDDVAQRSRLGYQT